MKMDLLLNYVDYSVSGDKEGNTFPFFVAGYLQEVIQMKEFENVVKQVKEKIKHLSFLVHLMCRDGDFDKVLSEYSSVQEDLSIGNIGWEDDKYFREWEKLHLNYVEEVKVDLKDDIDMKQAEVQDDLNFKEELINNFEEANLDTIQIGILKKDDHVIEDSEELHLKKNKFRCKECDKNMRTKKGLKRHLFTVHEEKLCEKCGKLFDDFQDFWQHRTACGVGMFVCEFCKVQFKSEGQYENHKETVHNVPRKLPRGTHVVCQVCGDSVYNIYNHMKTAHSSNEKKFSCQFCDVKVKRKGELARHIRIQHTNVPSTCPHCGGKFKNVDNHITRMKCYLPPDERPKSEYPCTVCGKSFAKLDTLRSHMNRVHGEEKQCNLCDFKTKYPGNLRMHIKTVHEKKPVKETCPYCSKICISLEWHISTYHSQVS